MTPTEDDLRGALRLLEQRSPQERLDVAGGRIVHSHRTSILRLGSVAALVLVVAGAAALIALNHDPAQPTQSGPTGSIATRVMPPVAALATLHVRVALFGGGAPGPNGRTYADNRPQPNATVVVTSVVSGHSAYESRLRVTATTNRHGVAAFTVPPGRYSYHWNMFRGKRPIRLTAGEVAHVQIDCAVP